ncbi:anti-sigma regulatory factor [Iocasia frigidifontis]|uniref:Anti-sigma regulatory factor n=1 Tax=Iocasia fonsfrigidae TaxID=2682810 RepID=A0A8A7KPC1_9FIRM|nr:ATP-binding protein [Iocasia fonsfrigidae]AZO93402.1 anti-sigma regulatory factor [Halocella sp. SP3-1]QTL99652.1 anti-sigma regulatory factor [Iocasia fonsfrigidae]
MEEHAILEKEIDKGDFSRGGEASSELKALLRKLGINNTIIRRAAIVTYELEMNIIIHSEGGNIKAAVSSDEIFIYIDDEGPGIEDLEKAFQPGYSTASDEVREMGFGAGMGLVNVKNYSDQLEIDTAPGEGTSIKVVIAIK